MRQNVPLKRKTPLRAKTGLKRTPFKRTSSKGLKSTTGILGGNKRKITEGSPKRKRRKKTERQRLEDKLWELCKQITRKRYQNEDGTWTCYTSGSIIDNPKDCHTGHGKPFGALSLKYKYDLRNLRPQSYHANINLGGMSDIFIAKLEREKEGLAFLKEACVKIDGRWEIKRIPPMGSMEAEEFLRAMIEKYRQMV